MEEEKGDERDIKLNPEECTLTKLVKEVFDARRDMQAPSTEDEDTVLIVNEVRDETAKKRKERGLLRYIGSYIANLFRASSYTLKQ